MNRNQHGKFGLEDMASQQLSGSSNGSKLNKPKRQIVHPKRTKWGRVPSEITKAELQGQFYLPMEQAAQELGVGLTVLKQICRKFGIARWPFRKVFQLKRLASVAKDFRTLVPLIMEVQVPAGSQLWTHFDERCQAKITRALKAMEEFSHPASTTPRSNETSFTGADARYTVVRPAPHMSLDNTFPRTGSFHSVTSHVPSRLSTFSSHDYLPALDNIDSEGSITDSEYMFKGDDVWSTMMSMAMQSVDVANMSASRPKLQQLCSGKVSVPAPWSPAYEDYTLEATDKKIEQLLQGVTHHPLTMLPTVRRTPGLPSHRRQCGSLDQEFTSWAPITHNVTNPYVTQGMIHRQM